MVEMSFCNICGDYGVGFYSPACCPFCGTTTDDIEYIRVGKEGGDEVLWCECRICGSRAPEDVWSCRAETYGEKRLKRIEEAYRGLVCCEDEHHACRCVAALMNRVEELEKALRDIDSCCETGEVYDIVKNVLREDSDD